MPITCVYNQHPVRPSINAYLGVDTDPTSQSNMQNLQQFWEYELGFISILIYSPTRKPNIKTHFAPPPILTRNCDWSAIDDSTYDGPGCASGWGATE